MIIDFTPLNTTGTQIKQSEYISVQYSLIFVSGEGAGLIVGQPIQLRGMNIPGMAPGMTGGTRW